MMFTVILLCIFCIIGGIIGHTYIESKGKCLKHDFFICKEGDVKEGFMETLYRINLVDRNFKNVMQLTFIMSNLFAPLHYKCRKCKHKKVVGRG